MLGSKNKVEPKTLKRVALITTEYNFRKIDCSVTKQTTPAIKKSTELTKGRQSSAFFSFLFEEFFPVTLKKNPNAITTIHSDKILIGSLNTTKSVKTKIG